MRHNVIFSVLIILLCFSAAARGKQYSSTQTTSQIEKQIENPSSSDHALDCRGTFPALHDTAQAPDGDQSLHQAQPDWVAILESPDTIPPVVHLDQDLKILEQRRSELAQCILSAQVQGSVQDPQGACFGQLLTNFEMRHYGEPEVDIPIGRLPGSTAFFYESGMTIDADGAPNAYHPDNSGLDDLSNAGAPGTWEGLAKDADGEPFIQGPNDPFPGYYVSATALADRTKLPNDPTRYVDASKIPFVVLPGGMARQLGARPGDFVIVFNRRNNKSSYAIFGDVGPFDRIGEGSIALAENIGVRSDPRNGGARGGIFYLVFPGSGNRQPRTLEEIGGEGERLLQSWENSTLLSECKAQVPDHAQQGNQAAN